MVRLVTAAHDAAVSQWLQEDALAHLSTSASDAAERVRQVLSQAGSKRARDAGPSQAAAPRARGVNCAWSLAARITAMLAGNLNWPFIHIWNAHHLEVMNMCDRVIAAGWAAAEHKDSQRREARAQRAEAWLQWQDKLLHIRQGRSAGAAEQPQAGAQSLQAVVCDVMKVPGMRELLADDVGADAFSGEALEGLDDDDWD